MGTMMNSQEYFDSLPSHYVNVNAESIVRYWLVGQEAVANHPETGINPNREGFTITEVKLDGGRIYVRGDNTCWFREELIKVNISPI